MAGCIRMLGHLRLALQVLLLAWKMGAKRMGFFSRDEFRRGAACSTIATAARLRETERIVSV